MAEGYCLSMICMIINIRLLPILQFFLKRLPAIKINFGAEFFCYKSVRYSTSHNKFFVFTKFVPHMNRSRFFQGLHCFITIFNLKVSFPLVVINGIKCFWRENIESFTLVWCHFLNGRDIANLS